MPYAPIVLSSRHLNILHFTIDCMILYRTVYAYSMLYIYIYKINKHDLFAIFIYPRSASSPNSTTPYAHTQPKRKGKGIPYHTTAPVSLVYVHIII